MYRTVGQPSVGESRRKARRTGGGRRRKGTNRSTKRNRWFEGTPHSWHRKMRIIHELWCYNTEAAAAAAAAAVGAGAAAETAY